MKKRIIAVFLVLMLLTVGICNAATENALYLQNVVFQEDGTVDIIVSVPQTENLQPADFTVVANKDVVAADSVASIGRSDVVTNWVFVIDLSMNERFVEAKNTVSELAGLLPEKDQVALMTPGMAVSELQWTTDKAMLKTKLDALKRNSKASALNSAIADVVTMLETQDSKFDRTCVVVVSSGENSDVTGMTQNELVAAIANSNVAVYTYAYMDSEPNNTKISNYGAYARAGAGGAEIILRGNEKNVADNAGKVMQNELRFRVVKLPNANLPKEISSFTVSFQTGAAVLTDEYQLNTVRQLAYEDWLNVHRPVQETATPAPVIDSDSSETPLSTPVPDSVPEEPIQAVLKLLEGNLLYILGGVLVLLLLLLIMLKRRKPSVVEEVPDLNTDIKPEDIVAEDEGEVTVVDTDSMKLLVKLTRTDDGSVHSMTMNDSMIIGRKKPDANLVITGDDKLSRVHAKLTLVKGTMVLENLGSNGTYVNGKKIDRPVQLHQQDVLKMGEKYYQISWRMQ